MSGMHPAFTGRVTGNERHWCFPETMPGLMYATVALNDCNVES